MSTTAMASAPSPDSTPSLSAPGAGVTPCDTPREARVEQGGVDKPTPVLALPVAAIDADPYQPRKEFDQEALVELAGSLLRYGQLQPITVRTGPEPGRYTILCGERRWRAAQLAKLATVAAVVDDSPSNPARDLERQLVENVHRRDLAPMDQARAYRALMTVRGWSARRLAQELSVSYMTIFRALELCKLPESVQADVAAGRVSPCRARAEARDRAKPCQHECQRTPQENAVPPAQRRAFPTRLGRVIVELDQPGDRGAIIESVIEVCNILRDEGPGGIENG